jgi:farnesyl diphosphate synthase
MIELFMETTYQTELGQLLDLRSVPPDTELDFSKFTMDVYKRIVKYKTAFYSFYLPIAAGLLIVGVNDEKVFKESKDICIDMGEYFQVQDDFLDCFADPKVLGKVGRDIEEKKCCWMICKALSLASEDQKKILKDNYGIDDAEKVKKVKQVYIDLNMKKAYADYEEVAISTLKNKIGKSTINHEIFLSLLSKIEKRTK